MDPLPGYLDPEAREAETRRLAARAGGEVVAFGRSVEGRPLLAARVPTATPGAPRVLCLANLHGLELVGTSVALGLLSGLADGTAPRHAALRRAAEVWVVPSLNPDGHARTFAQGGAGPVAALRCNVDLNRNFPRPHGAPPSRLPFSGSDRPGASTYRGPAPLSEPESAALDGLLEAQGFRAVLSLHSTMGTLIPARVLDRPSAQAYRALCATFTESQRSFRYRRLQGGALDAFTGELEDHAHHRHRAWACCVEVYPLHHDALARLGATASFWRFNPRRPERYVENDAPAAAAYLAAAATRPRPGEG
jgi:predicted deacylase